MSMHEKTECIEVGARSHSEGIIADSIISVLNTLVRGVAKVVTELQSIHGELTLTRQAQEKQAEQTKRLADSQERLHGDVMLMNERLTDILRNVEGTYSATSVCRALTIRISNGLQAALPSYLDGAKESYKDVELFKDKLTV